MIKESVGNKAQNKEADLKVVKTLVLKIHPPYNVAPTDKERGAIDASKNVCEPELITYLARFQKMSVPNEAPSGGRVMPGGNTIKRLKQFADACDKTRASAATSSAAMSMGLDRLYREEAPADTPDKVVIIRDVRLHGWKPDGEHVLEVGEDTPLSWPIQWVVDASKALNSKLVVQIMAHGAGVKIGERDTWSWKEMSIGKEPVFSQGGGGVQFCDKWITLATVKEFAAWKGKVSQIDLLSCGAAYITGGFEGKTGDGNLLCYTFAQHTGARVRASTATQMYYPEGDESELALEFGEWEGMVYTYGSSGELLRVDKGGT